MRRMLPAAVIGAMLLAPATASAFGFGLLWPRPRTVVAYYSPRVVCLPLVQVVPVRPVPPTVEPPLAQPTTAPPSTGPVAPAVPRAPQIKESQSHYNSSAVARWDSEPPAGQVPVSFWNRSGRTVTLKIDGQTRVLAPGNGLTLDLPRQFIWQADRRESRTESVPANAPAHEIAIRQ